MGLAIQSIRYGDKDVYSAYAAYPERAPLPLPAIVVIQEVWGVNDYIENVTRRFARAGYVAFAPDLLAREGKRPAPLTRERLKEFAGFFDSLPPAQAVDVSQREAALAKKPEEERRRLTETMQAAFGTVASNEHLAPLVSATKFLRSMYEPSRGSKVGSVGFCMGGRLSALLACSDPELDAAAIFYGMSPPEDLVANIRCPVVGFYGALDKRITDGVPAFAEAMNKHGKVFEHRVYEGAQHGFFNDNRPNYHVASSRDAFVRGLGFFQQHLAGGR